MATEEAKVLVTAVDRASAKFKSIGQNAGLMSKGIKAGIASLAGYLTVSTMKSLVDDFAEAERVTNRLSGALDGLGKKSQLADMQSFADEIQRVTTISDNTAEGIMSLGVTIGDLSGDTLKQATMAAIGFSKSFKDSGESADTFMTLIAKAAKGSTESFARYGIIVDKTMTDQEKFQAIIDKGIQGFKIAESETDTLSGKMAQLGNAWDNFKEKMGGLITETLHLPEVFDFISFSLENFGAVWDIAWTGFKISIYGFYFNMKDIFVVKIPDMLGWLADKMLDFTTFVLTIFTNMWANISDFFSGVWSYLKGEEFNFEWTGLLTGFESTVSQFPDILHRHLDPMEEELMSQLDKMQAAFGVKWAASKMTIPTGPLEIPGLPGSPELAGGAGKGRKKEQGALAAVEARYLTMSLTKNKTEENTGQLVQLSKNQNKLIEKLVTILSQKPGTVGVANLITANFSA